MQNGFRKGRARIDPLFSMELLIEREREREAEKETEFNLETRLTFLGYVEAFENFKKQNLKYYTIKTIIYY